MIRPRVAGVYYISEETKYRLIAIYGQALSCTCHDTRKMIGARGRLVPSALPYPMTIIDLTERRNCFGAFRPDE